MVRLHLRPRWGRGVHRATLNIDGQVTALTLVFFVVFFNTFEGGAIATNDEALAAPIALAIDVNEGDNPSAANGAAENG